MAYSKSTINLGYGQASAMQCCRPFLRYRCWKHTANNLNKIVFVFIVVLYIFTSSENI